MNLVPGAIWTPTDVGKRAARRKGRALVGHVAVSGRVNLMPGPLATRPGDWHFYFPKEAQPGGRFFQQIDLDLQSWTTGAGNPDCAAFESQGGLGDSRAVNAEPWSENQVESAAIVLAFMNETEGVPLEDMRNSLPTSRGFGVHRYGILHSRGLGAVPGYRIPGGQSWSSNIGKECPGNAKVAQVPIIVSRAREIRGGSPSPAPLPVKPAPAPTTPRDHPERLDWPLKPGQYVGDRKGPDESIGAAYNRVTRRWDAPHPLVRNVQQWLIYHGCVPGQTNWRSGWADGLFDAPYSTQAARRWHDRFYRGQPYPEQIWSDDYDRLARP